MFVRIPQDEIRNSLRGAFKLLIKDDDALSHFNVSTDGFWRSFQVFWILLVPFSIASLSERRANLDHYGLSLEEFPSGMFFAMSFIGRGLEWIFFPILLWLAADILKIRQGFVTYIIARNWCSLLVAALFSIPAFGHFSGIISHDTAIFSSLLLLGFAFVFHYRIARLTLEKDFPFCVTLIIADFLTSFILIGTIITLVGNPVPGQ